MKYPFRPKVEIYFMKTSQDFVMSGRDFHDNSAKHCMESVRIRSYSGPHFSAFRMNTERRISP